MSLIKDNTKIYIIDFFNIFSDFREIKYKKNNIDFHLVKHNNKEKDTEEFFDLFFTKYINYVKIPYNSKFIFIMKKLYEYQHILEKILVRYNKFDIKLMIIEDKYNDIILDKNKDDFLCQYIFYIMRKKSNCILISNDKYRDRQNYIKLFTFDISIQTMQWNKMLNTIQKGSAKFEINRYLSDYLITQKYTRCTIPKHKLNTIL